MHCSKTKLHERYHTAVRNYLLIHYIFKYSLEQIIFHLKFVGPNKMHNSSKSTSFFYMMSTFFKKFNLTFK